MARFFTIIYLVYKKRATRKRSVKPRRKSVKKRVTRKRTQSKKRVSRKKRTKKRKSVKKRSTRKKRSSRKKRKTRKKRQRGGADNVDKIEDIRLQLARAEALQREFDPTSYAAKNAFDIFKIRVDYTGVLNALESRFDKSGLSGAKSLINRMKNLSKKAIKNIGDKTEMDEELKKQMNEHVNEMNDIIKTAKENVVNLEKKYPNAVAEIENKRKIREKEEKKKRIN